MTKKRVETDPYAILKSNLFDPVRDRPLLAPWIASLALRLNDRLLAERKPKRKRR